MIKKDHQILHGSNGKDILVDITFLESIRNKKVVVFCHGFKGFKDWGSFNLVANMFAENNFVFVKFNFSHNGTTVEDPLNFMDLEAFGNNNFSMELYDLGVVLDWVESNPNYSQDISLLGHSRGGGISMLRGSVDNRVKRVISWASPSNFLNRFPEDKIDIWKNHGVVFIYNGRTKQNMPLYYQFYQDCRKNKVRFDIENAVRNINIPQLIVHGDNDPTVDVRDANHLHSWNKLSELYILKDADHVFGASHPFDSDILPTHLDKVVVRTIDFINQ